MAAPSLLPPLYAAWMDALLGAELPAENKAACGSCAMCAPGGAAPGADERFFSPVTKCCTYLPELGNFLVGRVLADDAPDAAQGRLTVEARIARQSEVTPLGLGRSPVYALKYQQGHAAFGLAESMECPHHLADGRCGVWRHRESTCATWFCKHERGHVGQTFWRRLHDLLAAVESSLARHCLLELRLPLASLNALLPARAARSEPAFSAEQLDGKVDPKAYQAIWGEWLGRERDFYRRCADIVNAMSWPDVARAGGAELAVRAELTRAAHRQATEKVMPARARQRPLRVLYTSAEKVRVCTYSALDPLVLPKRLLDVLHCFDGRSTVDALREIEAKHGVRVGPGVVQKLADFGVLVDE